MAGSKSAYLSQKLLGYVLGGVSFTSPITVYFALSSAAFDANATSGSDFSEILSSGNPGYARVSATNDSTTWSAPSAGAPSLVANLNDITFPTATADWADQPASIYLLDASSAGNILYGADFSDINPVTSGNAFNVVSGTFIFSED